MESFSSFFQGQSAPQNRWSSNSLKNFRQISPFVQNHLKLVYLCLSCALLASAVGVYMHLLWNIGGFLTSLASLGTIVWLSMTPIYEEKKKVALLMAAALFEGASIAPLFHLAIKIDPSILINVFVGIAIAFGCFSATATLVTRRVLYIGGLLSSGVSILLWLLFASIFGGSVAMFNFELYFGSLLFVWYMVVGTGKIVERAHLGDLDYVKHALTIFTDFFTNFTDVFVGIFKILLKNAFEEKKKKD